MLELLLILYLWAALPFTTYVVLRTLKDPGLGALIAGFGSGACLIPILGQVFACAMQSPLTAVLVGFPICLVLFFLSLLTDLIPGEFSLPSWAGISPGLADYYVKNGTIWGIVMSLICVLYERANRSARKEQS